MCFLGAISNRTGDQRCGRESTTQGMEHAFNFLAADVSPAVAGGILLPDEAAGVLLASGSWSVPPGGTPGASQRKHPQRGFGLALLLVLGSARGAVAEDKITYDDQVTPILRNNCFKCHNPDMTKAELDLTTYSAVLKGGGSGKAVVPGDPSGSKLYKAIARIEEPFMPNQGPKLPDADIEVIRKWIAGGLLEESSSQALVANKPKIGFLSNSGAQSKKPAGPEILPIEWGLEPAARTERTTAVTALAASP